MVADYVGRDGPWGRSTSDDVPFSLRGWLMCGVFTMTKRHQYSSSNNSINGIGDDARSRRDRHCQQLRWAKIFSLHPTKVWSYEQTSDEALWIYNTSAQNDPVSITGEGTTVLMYHCQCPVIAHDDVWLSHTKWRVNEEIENRFVVGSRHIVWMLRVENTVET